MAVRSGRFFVDGSNVDFRPFGDGSTGERRFSVWIPFSPALPPGPMNVEAALAHVDFYLGRRGARLAVWAGNRNEFGFELWISTWGDTLVNGVVASWFAHNID